MVLPEGHAWEGPECGVVAFTFLYFNKSVPSYYINGAKVPEILHSCKPTQSWALLLAGPMAYLLIHNNSQGSGTQFVMRSQG